MSDTPSTPKAELASWRAESLRLTVFPMPGFKTPEARGWWSSITKAEPESRTENPREGSLVEEGDYGGGRLFLRVDPNRVDWVYGPAFPGQDVFPSIGPLTGALQRFQGSMRPWLATMPACSRVACGALVWLSVNDRQAGYRQLGPYLPAVKVDPSSEDFLFQVNRPRQSRTVQGLRLNRVAKWSVAVLQRVQWGAAQARAERIGHAVRAELDVNSDATRVEVLREAPAVWEELTQLVMELVEQGDTA